MECGDYQGTLGFLDGFIKNNESTKKLMKIISRLSRNEIQKYIKSENVEFFDDNIFIKTDMDTDYTINQLKKLIGPKIKKMNSDVVNTILKNIVLKTRDGVIIQLM